MKNHANGTTIAAAIFAAAVGTATATPADTQAAKLDRADLIAAWTAKGTDCSPSDFEIEGNSADGQVVQTDLNGDPRTGYVRLGDEPAFVFDEPKRELDLEPRGADALAVMPPESGPVDLSDVTIRGDGVEFVKCPS